MSYSKKRRLNDSSTVAFGNTSLKNIILRARIKQLLEIGYKQKDIVETLNVSRSMVSMVDKRCVFDYLESFLDKKRDGRPLYYTEKVRQEVVYSTEKTGFSPRNHKLSNPDGPSRSTIQRIIKKNNLVPYRFKRASRMRDFNRIARLDWCKLMVNEDIHYWEKFLITDSKIFRLDSGYNPQNQRLYRNRDRKNEVPIHQKDKKSSGIHFYGGMSHLGLTDLIKVDQNVTSTVYIREVLPVLVKKHRRRRSTYGDTDKVKLFEEVTDFTLEQDHASAHDAQATQDWLEDSGIDFLRPDDTPPKMDDLWPIERVWAIMTQEVYKHPPPQTLIELEKRVRLSWKNFNKVTLKKLIHEIPFRIEAIIHADGGKIFEPLGRCECDICKRNT